MSPRILPIALILVLAALLPHRSWAQEWPRCNPVNPSAEDGPSSSDGNSVVAVPGWTTTGGMTVVGYGTAGPFPAVPFEEYAPSSKFFCGGPLSTLATATQTTPIQGGVTEFEDHPGFWSLYVTATFGGWQSDQAGPRLRVTLLDAEMMPLTEVLMTHTNSISFIIPGNPLVGALGFKNIPPGARFVTTTIELEGLPGQYNTSLVDDIFVGFVYPDAVRPTTWSGVKRLIETR